MILAGGVFFLLGSRCRGGRALKAAGQGGGGHAEMLSLFFFFRLKVPLLCARRAAVSLRFQTAGRANRTRQSGRGSMVGSPGDNAERGRFGFRNARFNRVRREGGVDEEQRYASGDGMGGAEPTYIRPTGWRW